MEFRLAEFFHTFDFGGKDYMELCYFYKKIIDGKKEAQNNAIMGLMK